MNSVRMSLAAAGLLAVFTSGAQESENPLFQDDAMIRAVLTAPISQAYGQKKQDVRMYFPGQWSYFDADGATRRLVVSIRTRGNFRRENCTLPPLQLNYKKKEVRGTPYAGEDKLKLVGPCKSSDNYQQNLLLEYLAYKTFELISDYNFRTRLLQLSYIDSDGKKKPWTKYSFLIEDEKDMAARLGLQYLEVEFAIPENLDPAQTSILELFQLMIGNTDYSTLRSPPGADCCHNVKLIATGDSTSGVIPIPYDFDFSGLVNARYATPPESLPIRKVRTRYFTGRCREDRYMRNAITVFNEKRDAVMEVFSTEELLDEKVRQRTLEYVEDFYELINDPGRVDKEIVGRCRGQMLKG